MSGVWWALLTSGYWLVGVRPISNCNKQAYHADGDGKLVLPGECCYLPRGGWSDYRAHLLAMPTILFVCTTVLFVCSIGRLPMSPSARQRQETPCISSISMVWSLVLPMMGWALFNNFFFITGIIQH